MATFDDVKKALEANQENGPELIKALEAHIGTVVNAEKETGKKLKRESDNEAKGLRERLKVLTSAIGLESENLAPEEFEAKATEAIGKLKAPKAASSKEFSTSAEYLEMKANQEKQAQLISTLTNTLKEEKAAKLAGIARDKLKTALKAANVSDKQIDDHANLLMKDGRIGTNEDGSVYAIGDDKEPVALDAFASKYAEAKPWLVENSQSSGSGGGGSNGGQGGGPARTATALKERLERVRATASDSPN